MRGWRRWTEAYALFILILFCSNQSYALLKSCRLLTEGVPEGFIIEKISGNLGGSLWTLAERPTRLLIGIKAKTRDGREFLATTDFYRGSHSSLIEELQIKFHALTILWAGEIQITRSLQTGSQGLISKTLNTSGTIHKLIESKIPGVTNAPENMRNIGAAGQALTVPTASHLTFTESYPHLFDLLNRLQKVTNQDIPEGGRHDINSILSHLFINLDSVKSSGDPMKLREAREKIGTDAIDFTIEVLQNYGDLEKTLDVRTWSRREKKYLKAIKILRDLSAKPEKLKENDLYLLLAVIYEYTHLNVPIPISVLELDVTSVN